MANAEVVVSKNNNATLKNVVIFRTIETRDNNGQLVTEIKTAKGLEKWTRAVVLYPTEHAGKEIQVFQNLYKGRINNFNFTTNKDLLMSKLFTVDDETGKIRVGVFFTQHDVEEREKYLSKIEKRYYAIENFIRETKSYRLSALTKENDGQYYDVHDPEEHIYEYVKVSKNIDYRVRCYKDDIIVAKVFENKIICFINTTHESELKVGNVCSAKPCFDIALANEKGALAKHQRYSEMDKVVFEANRDEKRRSIRESDNELLSMSAEEIQDFFHADIQFSTDTKEQAEADNAAKVREDTYEDVLAKYITLAPKARYEVSNNTAEVYFASKKTPKEKSYRSRRDNDRRFVDGR